MSESSSCPSDWACFYFEQRESLLAYALALCGNLADAQDLVQDVLGKLAGRSAVVPQRAYVWRCLRNAAIDRRRRNASRPEAAGVVIEPAAVVDWSGIERGEIGELVRGALSRLTDAYREVIVLRAFCELPFREVATLLEQPLGTVTSSFRRGLDELRELLREHVEHVGR